MNLFFLMLINDWLRSFPIKKLFLFKRNVFNLEKKRIKTNPNVNDFDIYFILKQLYIATHSVITV